VLVLLNGGCFAQPAGKIVIGQLGFLVVVVGVVKFWLRWRDGRTQTLERFQCWA
jgi:hypothetical protein